MRNSITRSPKKGLSLKAYMFGKERVVLQSQTYRRVYFNLLIRMYLFGHQNCSLRNSEIVYRSKNTIIFHIASQRRMKELFIIAGLTSVEFKCADNVWSCCGKVNVVIKNRNYIGYIVDESPRHWNVQLGSNSVRYIPKATYVQNLNTYHFSRKEPCITQYWPIRFKIHSSGETSYTLNRVCFDTSHKVIFSKTN